MQYVNLGKTGMKVSRLCLGMMSYGSKQWRNWILEEEESRPFVQRALEAGINFFDTADVYSTGESERITGNLLRHFGVKRENVIVATKVNGQMSDDVNDKGLSRKHILDSIDSSLKRLGMDYVDLYQIHRWDYETPIEETMEALNDVVRAGKARYIGASSMFAWQFSKAQYTAQSRGWTRFVSMQNHYNLVYREEEREMMPLCLSEGIGVIPWSPLARGRLARPWGAESTKRFETDQFGKTLYSKTEEADGKIVDRVGQISEKRGVPRAQVALAWLLAQKPFIVPIPGMDKLEYIEDNIKSADLVLTAADLKEIEERLAGIAIQGDRLSKELLSLSEE